MAAQPKNNQTPPTTNEDRKTIAVIQLARIGDLIQTYQACLSIKAQRPNIRIVLIARPQFASGLQFLLKKVFDKIYFLDSTSLLEEDLESSLENLSDFMEQLSKENIDALINLTYSKSSCYLTGLLSAKHRLGPYYNPDGSIQVTDQWSQFVYSNVLETSLNPFHLVDLFKRVIGIPSTPITQEQSDKTKADKENITIHPFASSERKHWKPNKWAEIIYKTLKDFPRKKILLVGSKSEKAMADEILSRPTLKNYGTRIKNLVGRTSLQDVYNTLEESCLFIGHDSMVGHLAAVTNTPSLTISLGSVRPIETTPYRADAYVLTPRVSCFPCRPQTHCDYYQCHVDISYQAVNACISQLINNGNIDAPKLERENSAFHVKSSDIHKVEFTDEGVFQLTKLSSTTPNILDVFRTFYRISWSFLLDRKDEKSPFPDLNSQTHQTLYNSLENIEQLYELSEFGKKYSQYILQEIASDTPQISEIKNFSTKIDEVDGLMDVLGQANPYLRPIVNYYKLKRGSLQGDNIVQLTEYSFLFYQECSNLCGVLYELIEKTIASHKQINRSPSQTKDT